MNIIKQLRILIIIGLSWQCLAASNGNVGATSQGSLVLSINIPEQIKISHISDIIFSTSDFISGESVITKAEPVCIYKNSSTSQTYAVTAIGSGNGGAFYLTNGMQTLPYSIRWGDSASGGTIVMLSHGHKITGINGASLNLDCQGGDNATLYVDILELDAKQVLAGTYTGTLTLQIDVS